MKTQQEVVLDLLNRGAITSLYVYECYKITRLAGVIWKLKKKGHNIRTEIVRVNTRYGKTSIARYILETPEYLSNF